jgi:hypothetical protein
MLTPDGRFVMWPRGVEIPSQDYLPSSETRVNPGISSWKLQLSESA